MFIYYTISQFGAVVFTIIMTMRQVRDDDDDDDVVVVGGGGVVVAVAVAVVVVRGTGA